MANPHPKKTFRERPEDMNLKGRPRMSAEMKAFRKYAAGEIIETYEKVIAMTVPEAEAWMKNPQCTITEYALLINMTRGNFSPVIDRIIGRIPEKIDLNHSGGINITDEEYNKALSEHLQEHKKGIK
jgi:hypothetical protein